MIVERQREDTLMPVSH